MGEQFPPVNINFAPVNVVGVPGLALVLVAVAIAMEFPEARWLLISSVVAGSLLAAIRIRRGLTAGVSAAAARHPGPLVLGDRR
jgi:hypothetical protein